MDTKGLQKEFINWCKSKNKQPKTEDETKLLFVAFMKEKHPEEYAKAVENLKKQQTTKALHGAKLNYFKNLKHQCADDEELYYYKKGGIVDCGCKKKNGGDIEPKKECGGGVAKFKMDRAKGGTKFKKPQIMDLAAKDSIEINSREGNDEKEATRPGSYKPNPKHDPTNPNSRTHIWVPDRTKAPYNKKKEEKKQPTYLNLNMSNKKGGTIEEFKKAKCGSKMKKHRLGGSILKFQKGTPKKGIIYDMRKPYMHNNAEYLDIESRPDKFGRTVDLSRQVSPRNDGTLNNDTTYFAFIHDNDGNVSGYGVNFINEYGNQSEGVTPRKALNRPFNTWGEYFKSLLKRYNKNY